VNDGLDYSGKQGGELKDTWIRTMYTELATAGLLRGEVPACAYSGRASGSG